MSSEPAISVLMPVYNGSGYLRAAVESVLGQTFADFELILLDDGSTDEAAGIVDALARRDSRIRVIHRANRGLTKSLNECLRLARGEFAARMDGDDLCLPERFQLQVDFLRAHPAVVLVGGAYDIIEDEGRLLRRMDQPCDDATLQQICLSGRTPICHPLAMFRTQAALKAGGYDEQMIVAQDLDLWLRLGELGQMACLPQVLLRYRMHETSVSEKKQQEQVRNMRLACERAWQRRGISGQFLGEQGWRATGDRDSRHVYALKYGWWAFNSGQRRTALHYGLRAVRLRPLGADGWRLLACASLKPLPQAKPAGAHSG
jgi:glycosyltransferase involved in cell wall biosynthesis